jgi:small subunit ribosomal protein S16
MLKIRLQRIGRKHEPSFRLVLTDSKNSTKSGKFLEILGNYDARRGEKSEFKTDRVSYWMSNGAQLSDTVHNLLIDKKMIVGKKINNLPRKTPVKSTVDSSQLTVEETKTTTKKEDIQPAVVIPSYTVPIAEEVADVATESVPVPEESPAVGPDTTV